MRQDISFNLRMHIVLLIRFCVYNGLSLCHSCRRIDLSPNRWLFLKVCTEFQWWKWVNLCVPKNRFLG